MLSNTSSLPMSPPKMYGWETKKEKFTMKIRIKWAHAVGSGAHPEEMFDQIPRLITDIIPQSQTKFANLALNLRVTLNKMTLNFMRQKKTTTKTPTTLKYWLNRGRKSWTNLCNFDESSRRSSSVLFVFLCSKCTLTSWEVCTKTTPYHRVQLGRG